MPATKDLSSYYSATLTGSLQNPGSIYSPPHMQHPYQLGTNNSLVVNMSGYYQQLMRDASVGALLPVTDGFLEKNAAVETELPVTDGFLQKNAAVGTEFPPEECYYAGTESDDDTSVDNMHGVNNMDSANEVGEMNEDINQGAEVTGVEAEMNGFVAHGMCDSDITCSELGDCGCAKEVFAQEISERYVSDMAAGYKKRHRDCVDGETPDCRKPRDMGAIEIALRTSSNRKPDGHIFEPILGMVFDSKEEAYEFYNMYAWEVGFGIIYNCSKKRRWRIHINAGTDLPKRGT